MKNIFLLFSLLISTVSFAQKDTVSDEQIHEFEYVDVKPEFKGGDGERIRFIQKNIEFPDAEKKAKVSGTCYVTFVIEKDGSLSGIRILRGVPNGPGYDEEVIRVVSMMPKWDPGKLNGKAVRVQFNLPVKFNP